MEVSRRDFGRGLAGASAMLWAIAPIRAIRAGSSPLLTEGAVRLILAGNDASGQSAVIEDKMIAESKALSGSRSTVIWASDGPYPTLDYSAARPSGPLPAHPGAAVFRIDRLLAGEGAVGHAPGPQHARSTSFMGYQVVIEGAMSFQTDEGGVMLKKGDALVTLGVEFDKAAAAGHACRLFTVLIAGDGTAGRRLLDSPTFVPAPAADRRADVKITAARRVVVARSATGGVKLVSDGYPRSAGGIPDVFWTKELWRSLTPVPSLALAADPARGGLAVPPAGGGSVFWFVELAPGDEIKRRQMESIVGKSIADAKLGEPSASKPEDLHGHKSLIFLAVVSGSVTYVTARNEVKAHAGDVIVQLGNLHSWKNDSGEHALLAIAMIDSARQPDR